MAMLFAILQKYDFSSKSQRTSCYVGRATVVCDTAKVRFFKQITTNKIFHIFWCWLFAILQKYDFSSKSQPEQRDFLHQQSCLRYCKSTIFQANHNHRGWTVKNKLVVCDTAKVRFFKQITTMCIYSVVPAMLFAILQKYDFSSKSQPDAGFTVRFFCCLRYCKSTIFQANHNYR